MACLIRERCLYFVAEDIFLLSVWPPPQGNEIRFFRFLEKFKQFEKGNPSSARILPKTIVLPSSIHRGGYNRKGGKGRKILVNKIFNVRCVMIRASPDGLWQTAIASAIPTPCPRRPGRICTQNVLRRARCQRQTAAPHRTSPAIIPNTIHQISHLWIFFCVVNRNDYASLKRHNEHRDR